jgi:hypothetical protein
MSEYEDYDYELDEEREATCKHCGRHFVWVEVRPDVYRLCTPGGKEHVCKALTASPEEFPEL